MIDLLIQSECCKFNVKIWTAGVDLIGCSMQDKSFRTRDQCHIWVSVSCSRHHGTAEPTHMDPVATVKFALVLKDMESLGTYSTANHEKRFAMPHIITTKGTSKLNFRRWERKFVNVSRSKTPQSPQMNVQFKKEHSGALTPDCVLLMAVELRASSSVHTIVDSQMSPTA